MSQDQTTIERLKTILADQLGTDESAITGSTKLQDDLGCDSLDAVELVMAVEEEFGIELNPDDEDRAAELTDVDSAVKFIDELLAQ